MRRRMPGAFASPFRSGFARGGFRRRFDNGFPAGPLLGPIRFGVPQRARPFFGFPRRARPFFGFPDGFAFHGFPHRHFRSFCFGGFCSFNRFPFLGGFVSFGFPFFGAGFPFFGAGFPFFGAGFPFFGAGFPFFGDGFPFFRGFPHHRFGLFGGRGVPLGAAPFGFTPLPWFGDWAGFADAYAPAADAPDTLGARETWRAPDTWPTLGRQLAVPGVAPGAGDSLVVERVSVMDVVPTTVLRLTWRSSGLEASQVALFVADSAQAMLAAQTLRAPPFTALLEPPPATAYVGMTAVWPDGTTTSRLVPYRAEPR
jgi:hypothetical protein